MQSIQMMSNINFKNQKQSVWTENNFLRKSQTQSFGKCPKKSEFKLDYLLFIKISIIKFIIQMYFYTYYVLQNIISLSEMILKPSSIYYWKKNYSREHIQRGSKYRLPQIQNHLWVQIWNGLTIWIPNYTDGFLNRIHAYGCLALKIPQ